LNARRRRTVRDLGALERQISLPDRPLERISRSPQETRRLGALLGAVLGPGDVVALEGDLGAGKTVFAQGMGSGLGVPDAITSPTFTLIHEYRGRVPFYHVDLYRLSGEAGAGEAEAGVIGLEEYLGGDGVAAVEWSQRAPGLLPRDHLLVQLSPVGAARQRRIRFAATGQRSAATLGALAARLSDQGRTGARG
jgi:tRNA threonylcarbamoyladenosine biosynthesis protein TsaE